MAAISEFCPTYLIEKESTLKSKINSSDNKFYFYKTIIRIGSRIHRNCPLSDLIDGTRHVDRILVRGGNNLARSAKKNVAPPMEFFSTNH